MLQKHFYLQGHEQHLLLHAKSFQLDTWVEWIGQNWICGLLDGGG